MRDVLMRLIVTVVCAGALGLVRAAETPAQPASFNFESGALRLTVGADGRAVAFTDLRAGTNYCAAKPAAAFASVKQGGRLFAATRAALTETGLAFAFEGSDARVTLSVTGTRQGFVAEVLAVTGTAVEEVLFVNLPLTLKGVADEPFAACALALNLRTKVSVLPGPSARLSAWCYPQFGFAGAKVALIGCPQAELRRRLQEVVAEAPELPRSPIGGPWALDAEINRGSYLFAPVTEANADEWIKLALSLGINQFDFDGMSRRGDLELKAAQYPHGREGLKAVVDKVHAAGLKAGIHTYAFFIDKKCPWVTPVPDPRLGKAATFTLAGALDATNRMILVAESNTNVSTVTGFFVRNSVTLQIDDELITFSEVCQTPPYTFSGCRRGACGTRPAPHAPGAKVHHLKECFGFFTPDPESTLLAEVAERQAQTVNACGFDMMYLDALDGADILGGRENAWHYAAKFTYELQRRFDHPVLLEMSAMHHHLWAVRSRMGAWDHPTRSHKRFIDLHCQANARESRMFLPMHLGWWSVKTWTGPQGEPTFADDIEYLCGKALGNDIGFSMQGMTPANFASNTTLRRLGGIMREYETARHAKTFSEAVKARLREPGAEFTLDRDEAGMLQLRPAGYVKQTVGAGAAWTVTNAFGPQPLSLRLEVLMSAEPYTSDRAIALSGPAAGAAVADTVLAAGVKAALSPSGGLGKDGWSGSLLTATNARPQRAATWAGFGQTFTTPQNLGGERALGVWVHGDGQGEVLNFQLACPRHVVAGLGEHYVVVDFTGWRYFELIEPEGERYADYVWPYGGAYAIYREHVDYKQIASLKVWVNNLPARGGVTCSLSPVLALPLVKAKISNPRVTVGGRALTLPVELESGSYLEFDPAGDCRVYGSDGVLLREVKVSGDVPVLESGANRLLFECDAPGEVRPRVRITTSVFGDPL